MSTKQTDFSRVYAPASIANLGPGFDVFGIAIDKLGDSITLETTPEKEISVQIKGIGAESIPTDSLSNSAAAVLDFIMKKYNLNHGFIVEIEKGVPPGKGLGSSGASAAATVEALRQLLGLTLSQRELIELAAIGEAAVSGSPHADNVSASLFGGFTMVDPNYEVIRLEPPKVDMSIVIPDISYKNKTMLARKLLPKVVELNDAVFNVGKATSMVTAVILDDPVLFGKSLCDQLVEPHRAKMIPNYWRVKEAALEAGAYGCTIAGGGPSLFAIGENPQEIGKAMADSFNEASITAEMLISQPISKGVRSF